MWEKYKLSYEGRSSIACPGTVSQYGLYGVCNCTVWLSDQGSDMKVEGQVKDYHSESICNEIVQRVYFLSFSD